MSVDFTEIEACYNGFTNPWEYEDPADCGSDSFRILNRKILTESIEIFNANIILGQADWGNQCRDSPIWNDWYARVRVGLFGAFLVFYIFILPVICIRSRVRSSRAGGIIGYFWFGLALLSNILYLMLAIIGDAFLNCLKISDDQYLKIYAGVNVFRNLANVLLLVICALPVTRHLLHHGGYGAAFATIINGLAVILIFLLYIVYMVLYQLNNFRAFDGLSTFDQVYGVPGAYVTLYLVTSLSIAFWITRAVGGTWKHGRSGKGITPYANLLAVMLFGFSIISALAIYIWKVHFRWWRRVDSLTFQVLDLTFQASVFLLLALLAGSRGLERSPPASPALMPEKVATLEEVEPIPPLAPPGSHRTSHHGGAAKTAAGLAAGAVAGGAVATAAAHRHSHRSSVTSGYGERDIERGEVVEEHEEVIEDDTSSLHSSDISELGSDEGSELSHAHGAAYVPREVSHEGLDTITEAEAPSLERTTTGHFREHLSADTINAIPKETTVRTV